MTRARMKAATLFLLTGAVAMAPVEAQQPRRDSDALIASGTLNVIIANRNGFVIAADSRKSSEAPFMCGARLQVYCDNSQKLFRTSPNSAMAIAGFAVGRLNTPLDLDVASALRRKLGSNGLPGDERSKDIPQWIDIELEDALMGVAAIYDPSTPPLTLSLTATFGRLDTNHRPILQQLQLNETWTPTGPQQVAVPHYSTILSPEVPVTKFWAVPVGINFIALGILQGVYKSDDPSIQSYYRKLKSGQLDNMPLNEMSALALAILRETKMHTDYVGGEDQIGEFPASGDAAFRLPSGLPTDVQLPPRIMRWDGITCTSAQLPPCGNAPVSFTIDSLHQNREPLKKFFMASEFKGVSVALDNNLFVANSFEGVRLKWKGGTFFSYRNKFHDCVLELSPEVQIPLNSELADCRLERKAVISLAPNTVGLPFEPAVGPPGLAVIPRGFGP